MAVLYPQLQVGQPRRFLFRPQCHRKSPVRLNDRVGYIPRIKDVLAAQGFHQVGHRQAQGAQSGLVDLSVQDHGFGPPGQQIEKLLAAEAQRGAQQLQRSNEKQRDQAGRHRNILRFNGDGRQIGDQDGGYQLLRLQLSQLTLAHQPHGKQNAEIQDNGAAKQQFHAQTLPVRCARRIPLRQSGHTAHTKE